MGNAVRLIAEFLRHDLIERLEYIIFQNFSMQARNSIYVMAADDCQIRHVYLSFF